MIKLEDFKNESDIDVYQFVVNKLAPINRPHKQTEYHPKQFEIKVAYLSECCYEGKLWLLLKHKETGKIFEVNAGHDSVDGFEEQFYPEETSLEYLESDKAGYLVKVVKEELKIQNLTLQQILASL